MTDKRVPTLTDEQIVAIRDECLPNQGERFDCIAFARAILAAAPAAPDERSALDAQRIRIGVAQLRAERDALRAALRWADSHVPGQVQCERCGYVAGGHAKGCEYAVLLAAPEDAPK
jgi:hypothetical protein